MNKIKFSLFLLCAVIMVSCSNNSIKTQAEISEKAIQCVNDFVNAIDKKGYEAAREYCFPYIFGNDQYTLDRVLWNKNLEFGKEDVSISPEVIIMPMDTTQNEFEQLKFNYAVVTAKIKGVEHKFYVVFDKGADSRGTDIYNQQGERFYKNTGGEALIIDADGFLSDKKPVNKGAFPNIDLPDPHDVISYAILNQNDNFKNRTYSRVIDLSQGHLNSESLPFTKSFGGYVNYTIAKDAKPANLIIATPWEELLKEGLLPEKGINMNKLEAKAIFSTGLGFRLIGTKIVDSYNLLDLSKYYAKHYSDIQPGLILPSSYYFSYSIGDADLIKEMRENENSARQYSRYY